MKDSGLIIIFITAPEDEEAQLIARVLLEQRKAACVNIVGGISSLYWWESDIEHNKESLLMVKTRSDLLDEVIRLVEEIHSYEVPEIIAIPVAGGNSEYLEWLNSEVQPEETK